MPTYEAKQILGYVGSTPSTWMSKRHSSITSSTNAAELSALRAIKEESRILRDMMRCLGCNVPSDGSFPMRIFGDNLGVILNAQNPAADLSKKHIVISFHMEYEAFTAGIIEPYWLKGTFNTSGIISKQIPRADFKEHVNYIYCHSFLMVKSP